MGMTELLRDLVDKHLSLCLYDNAHFYAERLLYESPSPDSLNLLALCYFRQGKTKQTYQLLKDSSSPENRYLFALACISLRRYVEAERALLAGRSSYDARFASEIPGGAAGLYLLGKICRKDSRKESAIMFFRLCLEVWLLILSTYLLFSTD
jgi:anaphase-promoting complex subunit 3